MMTWDSTILGYSCILLVISVNTSNLGAICINNAVNEHTQKLSDWKFTLNINEGVILSENYKNLCPQRIILSPNLYVQLSGALDLYEGLSENGANPIENNISSVKFIDLET
ncbi:MAG: hypothetical protein EZS28_041251, partial [Streblomastix strix]